MNDSFLDDDVIKTFMLLMVALGYGVLRRLSYLENDNLINPTGKERNNLNES